ncbi:MAG TPA: monovalent cation:proton antiporter-2 (CPA2) family protein [Edaphocola sp.]|nr:monovalent cation:proton antiporter-2 (CPA2) family protein [Edaphocola sp.]
MLFCKFEANRQWSAGLTGDYHHMDQDFFVQAIIYLGSAVLMVPIAKRFGLGSVLGYLLAGVIIGPSAFGWIGHSGSDIMHFAEMGVVMMLFLIGLEVEPKLLWRWRRAIVGLGGLQVIITAAVVGFLMHTFFGMTISQGVALGLIFSMSSTAIVLQTMTENNWMQTTAGHNAFSVLLFQDIAVILILAVLPLLSPEHTATTETIAAKTTFLLQFPPWARTLVVLGAVGVIVAGGRYLARPLFQMVAATNLRELFSATALLLVCGITVLMSLVGLSPALGAFLGGVVLANSEYRHELEGDIEPFKGLLLGLFFISVGASINFQLIEQKFLLVLISVLSVMIVKLIILCLLGWLFKMSKKQYLLFGFSLAQVGEFAFVLLTFSEKQNIFSKGVLELLMVVVAVSMALSPVFMIFLEKIWMRHVFNRFNRGADSPSGGIPLDTLAELPKNNGVIIAGYGRFGSVIGRFLKVNGIESTILDADSDRVETLRKIGVKAYYGDALRIDLLKSAGAENTALIVVALNGKAQKLRLVRTIQKHFPQAHIIARAHDQKDAYELMDAGVLHIYRETLDTSLRAGEEALTLLGVSEKAAKRAADLFLMHDEKTIKALAAARFDEKKYYQLLRAGTDDLHLLIQNDLEEQSLLKPLDTLPAEEPESSEDPVVPVVQNNLSQTS